MAEAAFSDDGKYYSAISQDGRLRIWDTETNVLKQEYTPDLHLTSPPSCLQWISATLSAVRTTRGFYNLLHIFDFPAAFTAFVAFYFHLLPGKNDVRHFPNSLTKIVLCFGILFKHSCIR